MIKFPLLLHYPNRNRPERNECRFRLRTLADGNASPQWGRNRSALEWVIGQYQVTEDNHSGIRSDPNRADDPEYIVRLLGQVIRVSFETVRIVKALPEL